MDDVCPRPELHGQVHNSVVRGFRGFVVGLYPVGRLWRTMSRLWRMSGIGYRSGWQRAKSSSISVTTTRIARVVSRSIKHKVCEPRAKGVSVANKSKTLPAQDDPGMDADCPPSELHGEVHNS